MNSADPPTPKRQCLEYLGQHIEIKEEIHQDFESVDLEDSYYYQEEDKQQELQVLIPGVALQTYDDLEIKEELYQDSDCDQSVSSFEEEEDEQEHLQLSSPDVSLHTPNGLEPKQQMSGWWSGTGFLKTIEFIKRQEFHPKLPPNPLEYFLYFVDENFLSMICQDTNLYAEQALCSKRLTPQSRMNSWKEVTVAELKIFIGLLLHMGTIQLPSLQDYWKTSRLFNIQIFSEQMSRNRFLLIFKCLHFTSKAGEKKPFNKIRKLIDHFNKKMAECYYPSRELLLDNSMVFYRGRLKFHQFLKDKRRRYGTKLYMLAEPNGTVLNLQVYTGAGDIKDSYRMHVVMKLLKGKLQNGHSLYIDKYYNSCCLVKKLLNKNTYCTGILRKDLKENPKEVVDKILKHDENISMFCDGVHVGKWKDVMYITTEYEDKMSTVANKTGQISTKPEALIQCEAYMSEIDHQDQMLAFYPFEQNVFGWHKKLFIHILQLLLINSHKIYNKYSGLGKTSLYDYRLAIITALLPEKSPRSVNLKPSASVGSPSATHKISKILDKTSLGRIRRKVCRQCSKAGKRKDSIFHCLACEKQPGLCLECFDDYHQN